MKTWMHEGIADSHLRHNKDAVRACETVNVNVEAAIRFVLGRFQAFDEISREFWVDISRERYGLLRSALLSTHQVVGRPLCGLRSEERRVGKEGGRTCRTRGA